MELKGNIVIELTPIEVIRLLAAVMDEDREEAYQFLKDCLEKKIQDRLRSHCVPVFEVSYHPGQKNGF